MRMGRLTSNVAWSAALVAGALAATAMSATGAGAASLISDGDFLNSNASYSTIAAGGNIGGVWTVANATTPSTTTGSVDLIGGYWQSPSGPNASMGGTNGSVDLDGSGATASQASISQNVNATTGGLYDLCFSLSGNPDGGPTTKTAAVTIDGVTQYVSFNIGSNTHSNMGYVSENMLFTLASGSNTITFASYNTPGDYGAVIGNVSLTATPLPATWTMLLAGFAGLGFITYRGAKKNSAIAAA